MRTTVTVVCASLGVAAALYFAGGNLFRAVKEFYGNTPVAIPTAANQSRRSTENDPVAQFKQLLTRQDKWKAVGVDKLFDVYEFVPNSVAIDVRKTDSLVFPLVGTSRFVVMKETYNRNGTLLHRKEPIFMEATFNYSDEKKQWSAAGWRMALNAKDAERGDYKSIGDTRNDILEGAPAAVWGNQITTHLFR